ncbi:exodeoxyribonuclease V subunit beta [Roseibium sp. RKSG952]|uniref:UvrD-helicase domain-containing protein n=1 Tax=Roseibium sp. RKSG952 TaxID=2529384 RepID=UPI0012BCABBC|nr:UvrD-helicase domain-containing protein [Roseibium sp. RKSG952]MTH95403.1 ATP-dependent endonuclease [Roseibium sp. RKSG952]
MTKLLDHDARVRAITDLTSSLLVEAGAGSGKTSIMAARVVYLMAEGAEPKNIVAVTFTEMAAGELLARVNEFIRAVLADDITPDLAVAFPEGASAGQKEHLKAALAELNRITCSTIHGFCQKLIKPYPADADIDPGARVADAAEADLLFEDVFEKWLRDTLTDSHRGSGMLPIFVDYDPDAAMRTVRTISTILRSHRDMKMVDSGFPVDELQAFIEGVSEFKAFMKGFRDSNDGKDYAEDETWEIVEALERLSTVWKTVQVKGGVAAALEICAAGPEESVLTNSGTVRKYRYGGKWKAALKGSSFDHIESNKRATDWYVRCTEAMLDVLRRAAGHALAGLTEEVRPLVERFRAAKRAAALLDFDDLMYAAVTMLREKENIRLAVGNRYKYVLVDEFQDTDPIQVEIFDRLTTDAQGNPKPGSFFAVGDPKQAIYRFRGADVDTYVGVREKMRLLNADSVLEVSTNFRSSAAILEFVNEKFEAPLSQADQPGFSRLSAFRGDGNGGPSVVSFPLESEGTSKDLRSEESVRVAALCAHLVTQHKVSAKGGEEMRPCRPGDIALLAPAGTEMWRYEAALEAVGLEVSTQAGKGFFQRQEVQDLIALTRVLADKEDTLALGSFLRGPVVGLTDEVLLNETAALPTKGGGHPVRLTIETDPELVSDPLLKDALRKLRGLHQRAPRTSVYGILSEAVELFDFRSVLRLRHKGVSERTLANVGRFLDLSRPYGVRGIRAFSDTMRASWEDGERQVEGKPDASDDAISIITMHSSKGLEWSVVIPINTSSPMRTGRGVLYDVENRLFTMPLLGVYPAGYDEAYEAETDAIAAEKVRLWYVAATRARDLLILPVKKNVSGRTWSSVVDLGHANLPPIKVGDVKEVSPETEPEFGEDERQFGEETGRIVSSLPKLEWLSPSRKEGGHRDLREFDIDEMIVAVPSLDIGPEITGGRYRGDVVHKLIEEVITCETSLDPVELHARSGIVCRQYVERQREASDIVLDAAEIAQTVSRAFSIPEVKRLEGRLYAELSMGDACVSPEGERVRFGRADCGWVDDGGFMEGVIDWKSDIAPTKSSRAAYREQLRAYMDMSGTSRGMIVYVTTGEVDIIEE